MTREEAVIKTLKENLCGLCTYGSQSMESCDIRSCDNRDAIKALNQESIIDKIRAEIAMYEADCRLQGGTDECEKCNSNVFGSVYRILDKYKAESGE